MYKEGITELEKELAITPGYPVALSWLGYAYAVSGRRADAQKLLDQLTDLARQKYVAAVDRARIYTGLGQKDRAFEWLEKGYEDRSIGAIKVEPTYDPLRSDPRFANLLRRMNLQP
jgi:tetratricopeptide (TPR) repeat protein